MFVGTNEYVAMSKGFIVDKKTCKNQLISVILLIACLERQY
jgi:hypothetical protein